MVEKTLKCTIFAIFWIKDDAKQWKNVVFATCPPPHHNFFQTADSIHTLGTGRG